MHIRTVWGYYTTYRGCFLLTASLRGLNTKKNVFVWVLISEDKLWNAKWQLGADPAGLVANCHLTA